MARADCRSFLLRVGVLVALVFSARLPASETLPLLLAATEQGQVDVSLYLVSEKLDGVRAFWDGKVLRTRNGNVINAPSWFVAGFPQHPLDGELWLGRGQFEQLSATVRRQVPEDAEWHKVRYMIFELPQAPGTFRQRVDELRHIINDVNVPWLQLVAQYEVKDRRMLEQRLSSVINAGGEGLMLHRADAVYSTGRSDVLLKMKRWHDAEAMVVGYMAGRGKFKGMLGALKVRTAEGVEFSLGTGLSVALRKNPPPVGALVTYRYQDLSSNGRPRFASFYRVRDI